MDSTQPITELLRRYDRGDQDVWRELVPYVYDDLRRIAHQRLRGERSEHTLSTTALVNETYLRLVANQKLGAEDRDDFLALVSQTMRRLLVDYARTRKRLKRGAGVALIPLDGTKAWLHDQEIDEVLALDEALDHLKTWDLRAAQVVELRYFVGFSLEETATALGIASKSVQRTWAGARAWLRKEMAGKESPPLSGHE